MWAGSIHSPDTELRSRIHGRRCCAAAQEGCRHFGGVDLFGLTGQNLVEFARDSYRRSLQFFELVQSVGSKTFDGINRIGDIGSVPRPRRALATKEIRPRGAPASAL